MKKSFGILENGREAKLYTIRQGNLEADISDFGATLVSLWVPDREGNRADVVLGFENANAYIASGYYLGATVGRNANRVGGASFRMGETTYRMAKNNGENNLHSGPDSYGFRIWDVAQRTESSVTFTLESPDGDQGFPGNAKLSITYTLEDNALVITYDALCDKDTVFNMTNHAYFNLAGHENEARAVEQVLSVDSDRYVVVKADNIPTGEVRFVEGTPLDFRQPKAISRDIDADYPDLKQAMGYDQCFLVSSNPCAVLSDPLSGRTMQVVTDCPGVQLYTANDLEDTGKEGAHYGPRSGVCLETQFYPDAVNHPQWPQPFVKAGVPYHSQTKYIFG